VFISARPAQVVERNFAKDEFSFDKTGDAYVAF
jgi:hypothetical protein